MRRKTVKLKRWFQLRQAQCSENIVGSRDAPADGLGNLPVLIPLAFASRETTVNPVPTIKVHKSRKNFG
jgi:hypothetical protein